MNSKKTDVKFIPRPRRKPPRATRPIFIDNHKSFQRFFFIDIYLVNYFRFRHCLRNYSIVVHLLLLTLDFCGQKLNSRRKKKSQNQTTKNPRKSPCFLLYLERCGCGCDPWICSSTWVSLFSWFDIQINLQLRNEIDRLVLSNENKLAVLARIEKTKNLKCDIFFLV